MDNEHDQSELAPAAGHTSTAQWAAPATRKGFLKGAAAAGVGAAGMGAFGPAAAFASTRRRAASRAVTWKS